MVDGVYISHDTSYIRKRAHCNLRILIEEKKNLRRCLKQVQLKPFLQLDFIFPRDGEKKISDYRSSFSYSAKEKNAWLPLIYCAHAVNQDD